MPSSTNGVPPGEVDLDLAALSISASDTKKAPLPPIRLCAIYTRDALSLLSWANVEQWRLVSLHANSIMASAEEFVEAEDEPSPPQWM